MIFLSENKFIASEATNSYESHSFNFYWMGFLYYPGYEAGKESLIALQNQFYEGNSWREITSDCMGNFILAIYDKTNGTYFIATDPSGMFQCYYSSEAFSTHFLELIQYHKLSPSDLSPEACLEFIQLGHIYFGRTFFPVIKKLPPESIITWTQTRGITVSDRPIDNLATSSGIDEVQWQNRLGKAMKNKYVNMDLTGGSDTRFILATLMSAGIKPDTSTYGHNEERDVMTAKKIAKILNVKHLHQTPLYSEPDPHLYFNLVDGLADISKYPGFYQVVSAKQAAGYDLSLNGGGGGICKDFLWQQDFPFYKNPYPNWNRLFNTRISKDRFPEWLMGDRLASRIDEWHTYWLDHLNQYNQTNNTASYDNVFFEVLMREQVGHSNAMESRQIHSYSPLLERKFAAWCYNQSRFNRWINSIQRNAVTGLDIELAKLSGNHGLLNLSSQKHHLPMEIIKILNEYIKKGAAFYRRSKGTPISENNPSSNRWLSYMEQNTFGRVAFKKLQYEGLVSKAIVPNNVPARFAGRITTVGLLLDFIEQPPDRNNRF